MQIPFLSQDQKDLLSLIRTEQANYEIDIMADASIALGLEEEDIKAVNELNLALEKVEDIVLITNDMGAQVLEMAKLSDKTIQISNRPALNDLVVVAVYLQTEMDKYSLFGKTLVPLRVFSYANIKKELGLVPKTKAFGKM